MFYMATSAAAPRFSVPEGVEVPRQFLCPISQDLMADPVMLVEVSRRLRLVMDPQPIDPPPSVRLARLTTGATSRSGLTGAT